MPGLVEELHKMRVSFLHPLVVLDWIPHRSKVSIALMNRQISYMKQVKYSHMSFSGFSISAVNHKRVAPALAALLDILIDT